MICCCCAIALASDELSLKLGGGIVNIQPQTLAMSWVAPDAKPVELSAAQDASAGVSDTLTSTGYATWVDAIRGVTVVVRAENETELSVTFRAEKVTQVVWPVITAQTSETLYSIPYGMGYAIPAGDEFWHEWAPKMFEGLVLEALSFPALGRTHNDTNVTYIFENPFHTELAFTASNNLLGATATHAFTRAAKGHEYRVRVAIPSPTIDPLITAKVYREWLSAQGELPTLAAKVAKRPAVDKLLGAAHVYVWGAETAVSGNDLPAQNKRPFFADLRTVLRETTHPAHAFTADFPDVFRADLRKALNEGYLGPYYMNLAMEATNLIADAAMKAQGFNPDATEAQKNRRKQEIITELFPDRFYPIEKWGGAFSVSAIEKMKAAGLDRMWLGLPSWQAGLAHPDAVKTANEAGYLVGPYDSYHSMHKPDTPNTWETAQFGLEAFEAHPIVRDDGTTKTGFKKVGRNLAPTAAMPYVKERIGGLMAQVPQFNSWFFDCDAFGEVFDNYNVTPPDTQQLDCAARLERVRWAGDTYGMVIGSEGGNAFALPVVDFAHGIFAPNMAWGDGDMYDKEKNSPYYLGRYYPPDAPEVFFKPVPLRDDVYTRYFHPQYRVPLQRAAVGDCMVAAAQWANGAHKFTNAWKTIRLTELLYGCPPLDHVSSGNLDKWLKDFAPYYAVNSRLSRFAALQPMTSWQTLTPDKMVQQSVFGMGENAVRVTVNFTDYTAEIHYPNDEKVEWNVKSGE